MQASAPSRHIAWINPLIHPVYDGWLAFFSQQYSLDVYAWTGISKLSPGISSHDLAHTFTIDINNTSFEFFKRPRLKRDAIRIVGDIYTNALAWTMRRSICYTEFFLSSPKQWMLFWLSAPWFAGRKFIVPTMHAKRTIRKITKKVFYLPQLYAGETRANRTLGDRRTRVLFVGLLDDWKKNVRWMLDELKDADCDVTLCGRNTGSLDLAPYRKRYGKRLTIMPPVPHEKISQVYGAHNVFVLPSKVDPIGAVVLEAMAHSLPVVVSRNAGSSSYVVDRQNGFIIDVEKEGSLAHAIAQLSPGVRTRMGAASRALVEERHSTSNKALMRSLGERFDEFLRR